MSEMYWNMEFFGIDFECVFKVVCGVDCVVFEEEDFVFNMKFMVCSIGIWE